MIRRLIILLLIVGCGTEPEDCIGVAGGEAGLDSCAVCIGGTTNLTACVQDCADVWGGTAAVDNCGVCDNDSTNDNDTCKDCLGIPFGENSVDICGICDANSVNDNECFDCNQQANGTAYIDNCGGCVEVTLKNQPVKQTVIMNGVEQL